MLTPCKFKEDATNDRKRKVFAKALEKLQLNERLMFCRNALN